MKITLIGGSGFIGHSLALELKQRGHEVTVIDSMAVNNLLTFLGNGDARYRSFIDERLALLHDAEIPQFIQDARDYHALSRLLGSIQPDAIVHLAAVAHAGKSNKDPYSTFDHSLRTLENALDYAKGKVSRFVYFSSSMVYGNFATESVTEDAPLNPIGIYGALKLAGELMVKAYGQVFDLPYVIVRPSALYGPRCVSRRVLQVFIESALKGETLKVSDERIDFTYIDDLVAGVCLTLERSEAVGETFNLTYGEGRSVEDAAQIVCTSVEGPASAKYEYTDREAHAPKRGALDVGKAKVALGYSPHWPLERGLAKYLEWYRGRM